MNEEEHKTELDLFLEKLKIEDDFRRKQGIVAAYECFAESLEQHIHDGKILNHRDPFPDQSFFKGYQRALTVMMTKCRELASQFKEDDYEHQ